MYNFHCFHVGKCFPRPRSSMFFFFFSAEFIMNLIMLTVVKFLGKDC